LRGRMLTIPQHEVIIGRDPECAIRMGSEEISREHCALKGVGETILVRDLGSSNGTYVNGFPINTEVTLRPGDRLTVGPAEFVVDGPKQQLMDDDVADWLMDGDSKVGISSESDTAIYKSGSPELAPQGATSGNSSSTPPATPKIPRPAARKFASLAEEAQDIIRRHFEAQTAEGN